MLLITGSFAVFAAAAEQSFLPGMVPRHSLVIVNARLGQSMTVAQSAGPPLVADVRRAAGPPVLGWPMEEGWA